MLIAGCVLGIGLLQPFPARGDDVMRLHFIDVGQGAATLVEFPCGAALIDTGGERSTLNEHALYSSTPRLMRYLRAFFKTRPDLHDTLDLLVLTHPHIDHTRGVPAVLQAFKPRNVVYNGQRNGSGSDGQNEARTYAKENAPDVDGWYVLERTIKDNQNGLTNGTIDPITCQSTHTTDPNIRVLWGQVEDKDKDDNWYSEDFGDENNHSVVVRIDYGKASVLFTGDLEEGTRKKDDPKTYQAGIERLLAKYAGSTLLDVDVYHVGHHGSHNGTTPALVAAMSPKIAVISAGPSCKCDEYCAYVYGHPRKETIDDLVAGVSGTRASKTVTIFDGQYTPKTRTITKAIYSTGWDGTVVLEGRPDGAWQVVKTTGAHACGG